MGKLELLKATYTGSVGETTGASWKGKPVVKGKIWSKAPNNEVQTQSVRAFECLNRVASAMSGQWFYRLGITAKNMHKHNAVARLLKPAIASHTFDPSEFNQIFAEDGTAEITSHAFNPDTQELTFTAQTTFLPSTNKNQSWLVMVFGTDGKTYLCTSPNANSYTASFLVPVASFDDLFIATFTSEKVNGKVRLGGFSIVGGSLAPVVTFALASNEITRTDTNDTISLTASQALPAGTNAVKITTHAIRQIRYADTTLDATLVTDGTTAAKLVFAPATDTLDQKDIFTLDSYVALEAGNATFGEEIMKWKRQSFNVELYEQAQYLLANDITITADTDGYTYDWGFPLPDYAEFQPWDTVLNTVTGTLAAGTTDNVISTLTYNADRTAAKNTWENPVIWGSDQTAGTSGAYIGNSSIIVNIDFLWSAPNDPVFPPMSREIAFDYAAGAHHWATQGGPVMRSDTWSVTPTGNFTTGSTKVVNATGSAAGSSGSCAFSTLSGIASAGAVFLTFEFVPSGGFAPYASGTITVTDETYIEFTLATPIGGIEKFRINVATGTHTFTTS